MKKLMMVLAVAVALSGCATPREMWDSFAGISIKGISDARADAVSKVFDYDMKTTYEKSEALLKLMPKVSIYRKEPKLIAAYVINPDTTPVGLFFESVDGAHTKVEISSESTPVKEWVARCIFSEKVIELGENKL